MLNTEPGSPEVVEQPDGTVLLVGDATTVELRPDPDRSGWWFLDSPRMSQRLHTDDPDMVALFWWCSENSHPPLIACEIASETSVRVTTSDDQAHLFEADDLSRLRQMVRDFLRELTGFLGGFLAENSDPDPQ